MRPAWKSLGIVFATAVALSLFESVGIHVRHVAAGDPLPWTDELWRPLPHWLTIALLAPFAIAFAIRFRLGPGRWRRLPLHVLAAMAFSFLHTTLAALVYNSILPGSRSLFGIVHSQLAFDVALEVLCYVVIAVGTHAYLALDDARLGREAAARAEADLAQARLRILRSQLQPHVLFNTLQAISTLALRHDGDAVVIAIARLSDVLRAGLDGEGSEEVALERELEVTDSYLEIQRLRMGDRLQVRRDFDPGSLEAMVPTLLLQPLVENALKHGLGGERRGTVTLEARRREDRLELSVADDGAGLHRNGSPEGTGLRVTRERLRALYGEHQSLVLEPRPGGGTTVRVTLPFRTGEVPPRPATAGQSLMSEPARR